MTELFFVLASFATLGVAPSAPPDQAARPAYQLSVETEVHYGNRHGGPNSGSGIDLVLGVSDHRIIYSISNNCGFSAGSGLRDFDNSAEIGWRVDITPTEITPDHARVRVKWSRGVVGGIRTREESHESTVLLRPGDQLRLDTFRMSTRVEVCQQPIATLLVSLHYKEPPRARVVSTDLWLVHRSADGKETIQQQTVRTNFSQPAGFYFDALKVGDMLLDVFGELTPRAVPDGSIRLDVTAQREVFLQGRSQLESPNHSYIGTGGAALVFRPDDVVSFEIPMTQVPSLTGDRFTLRIRTRQIR